MTTVGAELVRLFPNGTRQRDEKADWKNIPLLPVDVFAAAGHLLEASGAYQYIVAPFPETDSFGYGAPTFAPKQAELDRWCELGREWAKQSDAREMVEPFWSIIWYSRGFPLVRTPLDGDPGPDWWRAAHALFVISDEASGDFGYPLPSKPPVPWANGFASRLLQRRLRPPNIIPNPLDPQDERHQSRHVALDSLSPQADRHVVRVLPKGRTTELGCVMRAFSHNLALLPPHGRANAYWHQATSPATSVDAELQLLLIPFPYILPPHSFQGELSTTPTSGRRWGRFCIKQKWLTPSHDQAASDPASRASFVRFADALLRAAKSKGTSVNGILLPEYALDWETYDALVRHVRDKWPDIEFLVSGVSGDCNGRPGNQVTMTVLRSATGAAERLAETHSRRKHHRWQLNETQIGDYGLEEDLAPDVVWWEHLIVEERVLHTDVLRGGSTMTAVICEDLARVDPGLALLRSIGSNLVFALLMDGPQLKRRWPGTYATSLADDPGSSVLSFTSLALVDQSNKVRAAKKKSVGARTVGLWKNRPKPNVASERDFMELSIASGDHALVVTLHGEAASETTIDGRPNSDTTAWYLDGCESLGLSEKKIAANKWAWIVGKAAKSGTKVPSA